MALLSLFNTASCHSNKEMAHRIEQSPQFDEDLFTGNQKAFSMTWKTHVEIFWRFIAEKNQRVPAVALPGRIVKNTEPVKKGINQLSSTWLGHSTILINIDGYLVLTDPVFEEKVSLVGPVKFKRDVSIDYQSLPPIDVVVISHDHYDHLNKKSIQMLSKSTQKFVVPLGVGKYLRKWGVSAEKIVQLDWWENYNHDQQLSITATPAQHFSGRGLTDRNKTLWASWVIHSNMHKVFFSGDSGYFNGFKSIGEKFGPFDITFLECGAYDAMWYPVHMFPEETVQAHLDLKGNILHPIHWGTFNLALHPWYEPMQRLAAASEKANVIYATPIVGEVINTTEDRLGHNWWEAAMKKENKKLAMAE